MGGGQLLYYIFEDFHSETIREGYDYPLYFENYLVEHLGRGNPNLL